MTRRLIKGRLRKSRCSDLILIYSFVFRMDNGASAEMSHCIGSSAFGRMQVGDLQYWRFRNVESWLCSPALSGPLDDSGSKEGRFQKIRSERKGTGIRDRGRLIFILNRWSMGERPWWYIFIAPIFRARCGHSIMQGAAG